MWRSNGENVNNAKLLQGNNSRCVEIDVLLIVVTQVNYYFFLKPDFLSLPSYKKLQTPFVNVSYFWNIFEFVPTLL